MTNVKDTAVGQQHGGSRSDRRSDRRSNRRGAVGVQFTFYVLTGVVLVGGGAIWWAVGSSGGSQEIALVKKVALHEFTLQVTERGEVESANKQEIRCEVKSRNTSGTAILRLVPEGTFVQPGDFLVEFDSSALEDRRVQQQKEVSTSYAAMIEAQNKYEIALISQQEYLEGTFKEETELMESEVFVAEENLRRTQEYLEWSRKMAAKRYVPQLQLEADEFAVEKASMDLTAVKTKMDVLQRFTRAKVLKTLEGEILTSKADWEALEATYNSEVVWLEEIDEQIKKCVIYAPSAGQVKYAHRKDGHRGQNFIVEEGAILREMQPVIRLPDRSQMQVKVKISESVVDLVKVGMPVSIRVTGLKDVELTGTVALINEYSEPSNWRTANVKEYAAIVKIDGQYERLRSGMSAEATILCQYLPEAVQVPVQALHAHGPSYYVFVQNPDGLQARKISLGPTNDKHAVIIDGVAVGEDVALNPRQFLSRVELPELTAIEAQQVVKQVRITPELAARASSVSPRGSTTFAGAASSHEDEEEQSGLPSIAAQETFARLDTNGDGKLDVGELPEGMRARLAQVDTSGDGMIDPQELATAMVNMRGEGHGPVSGAGG